MSVIISKILNSASPVAANALFWKVTDNSDGTCTPFVSATLAAGTAILGKVGIDQTTPGTTNAVSVQATAGSFTDRSGTVTSGGTAQQVAAANSTRRYLVILNLSTTVLWVNFGVTAVADQPSIPLAAATSDGGADGGGIVFESSFVPSGLVSLIGATTGKKFVCKEG